MTKSRGILRPRHRWTKTQIAVLRRCYPHERTADLARELGLPLPIVYAMANRIGLHKSAAFQASDKNGRILKGGKLSVATQFKKGFVPANKGLRRPGWFRGRMRETQFRKGEVRGRAAQIVKPIGAERLSKDGYLERKVNHDLPFQKRWKAVHRIVWEAAHGPVLAGHAVAFLPGRFTAVREELTVDRLELVSRATLEALRDKDKPMDIDRAKAIADVARVVVETAKVEVQHINAVGGSGSGFLPGPEPVRPLKLQGGAK